MKQAIIQCGDNLSSGKVVNIIEISSEAALGFVLGKNQIMWNCDNMPVAIGDDWADGVFTRNGEPITPLPSDIDTLQEELTVINSKIDPFPVKDSYSSKDEIIGAIKNYKYSYTPVTQFMYGEHLQRNLDEDRARIHQSAYLLEKAEAKGLETSVKWQFMDNSVKIITDYNELLTMGLMAAALFQKAMTTQETLVAEVSDMEYKESYAYDVKTRFDEVFQQLA